MIILDVEVYGLFFARCFLFQHADEDSFLLRYDVVLAVNPRNHQRFGGVCCLHLQDSRHDVVPQKT
jgi:hypothetical protein